jgi:hypothetical protein
MPTFCNRALQGYPESTSVLGIIRARGERYFQSTYPGKVSAEPVVKRDGGDFGSTESKANGPAIRTPLDLSPLGVENISKRKESARHKPNRRRPERNR